MKKNAQKFDNSETKVSETNEIENNDFVFVEATEEQNSEMDKILTEPDELEETEEFIPLREETDDEDDESEFEKLISEQENVEEQEAEEIEEIEPVSEEKTAELSEEDLAKLQHSPEFLSYLKAERERRKKLIQSKIKGLQSAIASKEKKMNKERNIAETWLKESNRLIQVANEKFAKDKASNVIRYNESGTIEGKTILIEYYQKLIDRLQTEKAAQIESQTDGEFSPEFSAYISLRKSRFEKRLQSIQKYWIEYANKKIDGQVAKIANDIKQIKKEIIQLENEIA